MITMAVYLNLYHLILIITGCKEISSFQAGELSLSPELPVLGDNEFTLQCNFTLEPNLEQLIGLIVQRKRTGETNFLEILTIRPAVPIGYLDTSLEARTIITKPDTSPSPSVSIRFNTTQCNDIAEYKLTISYSSGRPIFEERIRDVKIKVRGTFEGAGYGITNIIPGYSVAENTNITVICKADVGAEPQGQLQWIYFKDISGPAYPISDMAVTESLQTVRECSHLLVSTLTMLVTEKLDNILIRCTLQQDTFTADGDEHRQTDRFNITYPSRRTAIALNPLSPTYNEGEQLNLTCSTDANPPPSFTWLLPTGEVIAGASFQLQTLQLNNSGNYTCEAKNGLPDENHTDSKTVFITVAPSGNAVTTTNGLHTEESSVVCCSILTTDQDAQGNKVDVSILGTVAGIMGVVIIAQGIALAFMVTRQKKGVQYRDNATYEVPDRATRSSEERNYNTVDHGNNGYEIPTRQTTYTEYEMMVP